MAASVEDPLLPCFAEKGAADGPTPERYGPRPTPTTHPPPPCSRRAALTPRPSRRFRSFLVVLALGSASAFMGAPVAHRAAKTSSLSMSYADEVGAQRPLGFWDPLSLVQNADQDRFDKLRFTEIKVRRAPRRARGAGTSPLSSSCILYWLPSSRTATATTTV